MASTVFVNGVTLSDAGWFGDVNELTYAQAISVKNSAYGAVCDGVADDTIPIAAAIVAAAGKTLFIPGTPRITSKLTIASKMRIVFQGGAGINSASKPSSYFIKGAAMTTAAVDITASGVIWEGGGVSGLAGNTGDGIAVLANSVTLRNVHVTGVGNDGFRHGSDAGVNANSCIFDGCHSTSNGRHGFFTRDSGSNNNCTTFINCVAQSNTLDGLRNGIAGSIVQGSNNELINFVSENNTGQGINIVGGSNCKIDGGDIEANTAGQILIGVDARFTIIDNMSTAFTIVDNGFYTKRLDRYQNNRFTFTPAIRGASGATKTVTAVSITGSTATATSVAHGYSNADTLYHGTGWVNSNLTGAFVISNVTANTYDFTIRTDLTQTVPTSSTGLTAIAQKCGTSSVTLGRFIVKDGVCKFFVRLTMSSITNITGSVQLVLPQATENIDANFYSTATAEYYTGITHTGKLGVIINQNGANLANVYGTISGVPGVAAQLDAAGLSATTDIIVRGEYLIDRNN